ncbi:MAG: hypothetical protein R2847_08755 [Bacteroidia bacterium]
MAVKSAPNPPGQELIHHASYTGALMVKFVNAKHPGDVLLST